MPDLANNGLTRTYRAVAANVPIARRELGAFAAGSGADPQQVEAILLASSEALTNVVIHAYRDDPGEIHVTAAVVSEEVWILIGDRGCGLTPRPDRPGLGLGLALIARLTDDFAIVPRSCGGVEVRMRFDLAGAQLPQRPQAGGSTEAACAPASSRFSTTT